MLQLGISIAPGQGSGLRKRLLVEFGKGDRKMIQGAAEHAHIIGVAQVGGQSGLGGLVLQIASQIGPSQTAAQTMGAKFGWI